MENISYVNKYLDLIHGIDEIERVIQAISRFNECKLFLTGGFLRNIVWYKLHNKNDIFSFTDDCDIIYYDKKIDKKFEKRVEKFLYNLEPNINWSVKNQARMHLRNKHTQYVSIEDALKHFPETASAVAIDGNWNIIAPFGVHDILNLKLAPTPFCLVNELEVYHKRIRTKKWLVNFRNLKVHENKWLYFQRNKSKSRSYRKRKPQTGLKKNLV